MSVFSLKRLALSSVHQTGSFFGPLSSSSNPMHDPIGTFTRIRELYLSYLDTGFRLEDEDLAEERRRLLRRTGALCTEPLIEPEPDT